MAAKDPELESMLDKGVPGYWYVVAKSVEIKKNAPLSVRALGRDLVLWRGEDGALRCLEDLCPHRGARLSHGRTSGNDIACRYHGVTVDGGGTVVSVPGMAECPMEGKTMVNSYAVREVSDGVFVYFPSELGPEPPELVLPKEISDPDYTSFLCTTSWACNYRYVLDNLADPMHGIFLHSDTFTLGRGIRQDTVKIEQTPTGFIVKRVAQQDVNFDWSELVTEGPVLHGRVIIPYPPAAGPGGAMLVITFVTPVDENICRIFFWRTRRVRNAFEREAWRFLFRALLEPRHWYVLEQDREMIERMPPTARDHEYLYQHDSGVVRLRRILRQKAQELIAKSNAAGEGTSA